MRRSVLAGLVVVSACRVSLSDETTAGDDGLTGRGSNGRVCQVSTTSPSCIAADQQNPVTLTWIEQNIFRTSCNFAGCHNGDNTAQGKVDLRPGMSYAHLVDFASAIDPARNLIVAGDVKSSYLMFMLQDVAPADATPPAAPPPADIGYMPQGANAALCCQKLDAIERWIENGAPSD
jgi:hypothetical protein